MFIIKYLNGLVLESENKNKPVTPIDPNYENVESETELEQEPLVLEPYVDEDMPELVHELVPVQYIESESEIESGPESKEEGPESEPEPGPEEGSYDDMPELVLVPVQCTELEPEPEPESGPELFDEIDNFYYEEDLLDIVLNKINVKIQAFDNKFYEALESLNKISEQITCSIKPEESESESEEEESKESESESESKEEELEKIQDDKLKMTYSNRKYGFIKEKHETNTFAMFDSVCHDNVQESVDLRSYFPVVYDQGHLGSCTSNAIAGAFDYYIYILKGVRFNASRLFIYYNEREIEHTIFWDNGSTIEDGMKSIKEKGACPENDWPYEESHFRQKPSLQAYKDALIYKTTNFAPIETSIMSFKIALSNGFPVIFGFDVYESFETLELAKTGIMRLPNSSVEKRLGGHAVLACGFDDNMEQNGYKGFLLCRNSWGSEWGLAGYFWMPYDNLQYCADCWVFGGYEDHMLSDIDEEDETTINTCSLCDTDEECVCDKIV
jgi:C1A family cysteine protease